MIIIYSILAFAMIDYFGYNLIGIKREMLYRIIQVAIQLIIIVVLWYYFSFISALCFVLLWFFGVADLLYYIFDGIFYLLIGKSFENSLFWKISYNDMSWLWFTPIGIYNKITNKKTSKKQFIIQSVIGIIFLIKLTV